MRGRSDGLDVLVVGSGIAGLSAALELAGRRRVAVVSKESGGGGSTLLAQGGIAARTGAGGQRRRRTRLTRSGRRPVWETPWWRSR